MTAGCQEMSAGIEVHNDGVHGDLQCTWPDLIFSGRFGWAGRLQESAVVSAVCCCCLLVVVVVVGVGGGSRPQEKYDAIGREQRCGVLENKALAA